MIGLFCFVLAVLASPFKSKLRLEAENAVLRHQLIVLRRKLHGRVRLTNNDRWFFIQLYRWVPSILKVAARSVAARPAAVADLGDIAACAKPHSNGPTLRKSHPTGSIADFPKVAFGSWLCENAKTLNRDRRSYSSKTVLVAQRASGFNLEIELKNIILRRVSIF